MGRRGGGNHWNNNQYNNNQYNNNQYNGGRGGRGGGGGRSNTWTRDGGGGGGGGGRGGRGGAPGIRRKDLLQEDLVNERPLWGLTCYGPRGEEPNLLGGDTSFEELRCVAYATLRAGGDVRAVDGRAREIGHAKTNDVKGILSFPEHQLKAVLDKVEKGQMAPAGADRTIEFRSLDGFIGGASSSGAVGGFVASPAAQGGGFAPQPNAFAPQQSQLNSAATPFAPVGASGGQFGAGANSNQFGVQPQQGLGAPIGAASSAQTGGFAPQQNFQNQAPLTPDPNVPNSEAWCAQSFAIGQVPDDPPPAGYIR